jgi:hypothetical protein
MGTVRVLEGLSKVDELFKDLGCEDKVTRLASGNVCK